MKKEQLEVGEIRKKGQLDRMRAGVRSEVLKHGRVTVHKPASSNSITGWGSVCRGSHTISTGTSEVARANKRSQVTRWSWGREMEPEARKT